MGSSNSKADRNDALRLCRERMRFIKQAVDSRYALSAAHLAYIQSLRNVGSALRRFAEAENVTESSLSASEPDKSPSHSSYASPSPSHLVETLCSPMRKSSPLSPRLSNISYMRASGCASMTVRMDSSSSHFVDEETLGDPLPPPPLPPEFGSSWDFFNPGDSIDNTQLRNAFSSFSHDYSNLASLKKFREEEVAPVNEVDVKLGKVHPLATEEHSDDIDTVYKSNSKSAMTKASSMKDGISQKPFNGQQMSKEGLLKSHIAGNNSSETMDSIHSSQRCCPKVAKGEAEKEEKELCAEREDPSEFITHRAKDFLSSIKDIEQRFLRAAESGAEVSRMLEANKIRLGNYLEKIGKSTSVLYPSVHLSCCRRSAVLDHEPAHLATRVITWKRSTSSLSSSSKNPLTSALKDECDSSSDFIEEFSMISGSHSSTLDRLYAWERKLYDEVKSSGSIRSAYDQKCCQLRHQFARDLNAKVIDKTRAVVKDLHSQVQVAIQAVDSISTRIEKLRDEELLPQLIELIQGLVRMWKAMLACHHTQHITITLAYHVKSSAAVHQNDAHKQILIHLQNEIECFASSFAIWVDAHKAYVGALNAWLQNCILLPQERSRGRKATFSPRRALAPPIFVLCRDWSSGIKALPFEDLSNAIKAIVSELHFALPQRFEEKQTQQSPEELNAGERKDKKCEEGPNLGNLQARLTRTFDGLTKFAEASLKMYEDIKQACEAARVSYVNGRVRFVF